MPSGAARECRFRRDRLKIESMGLALDELGHPFPQATVGGESIEGLLLARHLQQLAPRPAVTDAHEAQRAVNAADLGCY